MWSFGPSRNDRELLLPVLGQHPRAGPAEPAAILLQTAQDDLVTLIEVSAAIPLGVPRTGVMFALLLGRRRRSDCKKRNNEKNSGHDVTPAGHELTTFLMRPTRRRNELLRRDLGLRGQIPVRRPALRLARSRPFRMEPALPARIRRRNGRRVVTALTSISH